MARPGQELHANRPGTMDEHGRRVFLHPTEVRGRWQRRRRAVRWLLVAFFLVLPWLKLNGHQALLLNLVDREFAVLGLLFRAHDAPMVLFLLLAPALALGLATALFGRVWCGWACPQTVFIEAVFRPIERWIEGDAVARRKLDAAPLGPEKLLKRVSKWVVFALAALVITHSFLALFVGSDRLLGMVGRSPAENPAPFLFILLATGLVLFDLGWLREQFCMVACPYGKIQSVFLDSATRTVAYDVRRGEPRGVKAPAPGARAGDCVNCYRCVQVCPTGIDIRRGTQLECIGCTACIDACDDVMARLGRETGLIRYASEEELEAGTPRGARRIRWFRARVLAYAGLLLVTVTGFCALLAGRSNLDLTVLKSRGTPFERVQLEGGTAALSNAFQIELGNRTREPLEVRFEIEAAPELRARLAMPIQARTLQPGEMLRSPFAVQFDGQALRDGKTSALLVVRSTAAPSDTQVRKEAITLVGPLL